MSMQLTGVSSNPIQTALSELNTEQTVSSALSMKVLKSSLEQSSQVLQLLDKTLQSMGIGGNININA